MDLKITGNRTGDFLSEFQNLLLAGFAKAKCVKDVLTTVLMVRYFGSIQRRNTRYVRWA